jgi:hypothetical protein
MAGIAVDIARDHDGLKFDTDRELVGWSVIRVPPGTRYLKYHL